MMLEELQRRNFSEDTIRHYIHTVEDFARHFGRPPDRLGLRHIREYQAYLFQKRKLSSGSVTNHLAALRFFYIQTLKKAWSVAETPYPKKNHHLPAILSQEEVARLIDAADTPFHRTLLMTLCAKAEFGVDALRPKSVNTTSHVEQVVRAYLVPRFGTELAEDVKPLDIQRWLKSLHDSNRLAWPTISKMRGIMYRIYKIGILHEHVTKNPVQHVETRSKTDYKPIVITPQQTLEILKALPSSLHFAVVLACAATALRASEMLALRWSDILWNEGRIRISKRWAKGKDGETKTEASDGYVPLHPVLSSRLRSWGEESPYAKDEDFVFPSSRAEGRVPLSASVFVADHLRPAAKKAGVHIEDGQRFGLHNLRHSLSNWLVTVFLPYVAQRRSGMANYRRGSQRRQKGTEVSSINTPSPKMVAGF
jgi:integrase